MSTGKVLAVVQARMSSRRLPGKVLADVEGEPLLALLLARLRRAQTLDRIVVATSDDASDDAIAQAAPDVFRGPLDDVLARFAGAAAGHDGIVVRITADCPLIDPALVDGVVTLLGAANVDYASNIEPRTFPDGLDVEAFTTAALKTADQEATASGDREHVTTFIRGRPDRFPAVHLTGDEPLGELRWTVDTADDLAFVRAVVKALGDRRHTAGLQEILTAARNLGPEGALLPWHADD